jgi:hypothetical protein
MKRKRPEFWLYLQMRSDRPDKPEAPHIGCGWRFVRLRFGRKWAWLTEAATGICDKVPLKYWHAHLARWAVPVPRRGKVTLAKLVPQQETHT